MMGYTVTIGAKENTEAAIQRQAANLVTIAEVLQPDTEYQVTVERIGGRIRRRLKELGSGGEAPVLETIDSNAIYDRRNHVGFATFSGEMRVYDIKIYTRLSRFSIEQFKIPFEVEVGIRDKALEGRLYRLRYGVTRQEGNFFTTLLFEDITERRQAEEELRKITTELEERVRQRTEELARANEELRKEVTARKKAEETLKYRLEIENLIAGISTEFINISADQLDSGINRALKRIGEFDGIDRSYVFLFSEDGTKVDNTHEWCASGIEPQIEKLKDLPAAAFPWWMERLRRFENIYIPRVADLPAEAAAEKEILQAQDIQSLIVVPLVYGGSLIGFLGFDSVRKERTWTEEDISMLKTVGDIIVSALQRKRTLEALKESEKKYKTLIETTHDVIYSIDRRGAVVYLSPQVKSYGYTPEELMSHSYLEFIFPEDREKAMAELQRTFETGEEFPSHFRVVDKEGKIHWVEEYGKVQRDENGRIVGVTGALRDITARKKAEKELRRYRDHLEELVRERTAELTEANKRLKREITVRKRTQKALSESEERYRSLVETMNEGLVTVDEKLNITFVNKALCRILGCDESDLLGRNGMDFVEEKEKGALRERFQKRRFGDDESYELTLNGAGGRKIHCLISPRPLLDEQGQFKGTVAVVTDITELKRAEEKLRKYQDHLEELVEKRTAALRNSEIRLQERLRELTCLYNIRREFDKNLPLDETLKSCAAYIKSALKGSHKKVVTIKLDDQETASDGSFHHQDNFLETPLSIAGIERGFIRVYSSSSNWDFLPFELDLVNHAGASLSAFIQNRELREQLIQSEKLAAAGRLAAGVAHEINNPLGAIKNSLYILNQSIPKTRETSSWIKLMDSEIDRVAEIISQLYDLYKPSAQEVRIVDLAKVVGNVLKMLDGKIRRQKIVVRNECKKSSAKLKLSLSQITQVLYNIILNAIQAMPNGGTLTVGRTKTRGKSGLWIRDTGSGIPDDVLPYIFEPFYTTKTGIRNLAEGMGLGLSLSRSIMESLGGKISVKTELGVGTTFTLLFPAKMSKA